MIGYNPSHLNTNETLLEAFHRVEAYLKANPQYQVYQSSAMYQEGTQEYALNTIVVPEGSTVGKGDVVLFSNVYYAVITAVSETTFSVETATNFRGAQGEQGEQGTQGNTGAKGETGLPALTYSKSVTLAAYQSSFITELDGYNRSPQINDICLYVSPNTSQIINGIIEELRPGTQQVTVRRKSTIYAQGEKGEPGGQGANGKDGNATLLYAGELSESITTVEAAQITRPKNRGILVKDILISTSASTFGAMAQVTALPVGVTTVDVSFIGTLQSGGSSSGTMTKHSVSLTKENVATYVAQFENMIAPQLKVTTEEGTLILPASKQFYYNEICGSAITMNDSMFVFAGCNENAGRFAGYYLPSISGNEGDVSSWSYSFNEPFGTITAMDLIWYTLE